MKIGKLLRIGCLVIAFGFFLTCSANGQNTNGTDQTGKKMTDPKDKVNKPPRGIRGVDSDVDGQSSPTNFPPWVRVPISTIGDNLIWIFPVDAGEAYQIGHGNNSGKTSNDGTSVGEPKQKAPAPQGENQQPAPKPVPPVNDGPKIRYIPGTGGNVIIDGRFHFSPLPSCETDLIVKSAATTATIAIAGKVLLKALPKILAACFGATASSLSGALGVFIVPVDMEKIMFPTKQDPKKMTACLLNKDAENSNVILNPVYGEEGCYEVVAEDGNPYLICCDKLDDGILCSVDGVPING